jgi:hypothetical protein
MLRHCIHLGLVTLGSWSRHHQLTACRVGEMKGDEFEARVTRQLGLWAPRVVMCPAANNRIQELRCSMLPARPRRFASPTKCTAASDTLKTCQRALLYRAGDESGECAAQVLTPVTLETLTSCNALCGGLCAEFRNFLRFLSRHHKTAFQAAVCNGESPCFHAALDQILRDRLLGTLNFAASLTNRTLMPVEDLNLKIIAELKGLDATSLGAPPSLAAVICAIWGGGLPNEMGSGCGRVELNCVEGLMDERWAGNGLAPLRSMEEVRLVLEGCLRECAGAARREFSKLCSSL